MSRFLLAGLLGALLGIVGLMSAARADEPAASAKSDAETYQKVVQNGVDYLVNKGQLPDGSYGKGTGPGFAAICTTALLKHGRTPADPAVAKSLKYIETFVHPDGGVYSPDRGVNNYETSLVVVCLTAANGDGHYNDLLKNAEKYLKNIQWGSGDTTSTKPSDVNYGGAGYGREKRPDLSNTQFFLDALQAAGDGADDEAVKRAMVFVSRCQNLESEHNTTKFPAKNPDGGFYYTPAAEGGSEAGDTSDGGLRSYGSMTYAGLKSMLYAGLKPDDPRVKAAVKWIKENYTVTANPGFAGTDPNGHLGNQAGLYYYYHTFAKALSALGEDEFEDAKGVKHNWRHELLEQLAKRQKENGSWVNSNQRWYEQDPNLVTAYALLTLSYIKPKN